MFLLPELLFLQKQTTKTLTWEHQQPQKLQSGSESLRKAVTFSFSGDLSSFTIKTSKKNKNKKAFTDIPKVIFPVCCLVLHLYCCQGTSVMLTAYLAKKSRQGPPTISSQF